MTPLLSILTSWLFHKQDWRWLVIMPSALHQLVSGMTVFLPLSKRHPSQSSRNTLKLTCSVSWVLTVLCPSSFCIYHVTFVVFVVVVVENYVDTDVERTLFSCQNIKTQIDNLMTKYHSYRKTHRRPSQCQYDHHSTVLAPVILKMMILLKIMSEWAKFNDPLDR